MARKTVKRYGNTYIYEDGKLVQTIKSNTKKKVESGAQGQAVAREKKQTTTASSSNTAKNQPRLNTKDIKNLTWSQAASGQGAKIVEQRRQEEQKKPSSNSYTKAINNELYNPAQKTTYEITKDDEKKAQDVSLNRYKGAFNWERRQNPTSERTQRAAQEYIDAAFRQSSNISDNYKKMSEEARKKSRDATLSLDERKYYDAQANAYSQRSRDYQIAAQFDEQIAKTDYDYDTSTNREASIAKGKHQDTFLNMSDEDKKYVVGVTSVGSLNEDDTLRAASLVMTEDELNRYYFTVGDKGEEAARSYLKALYDVGGLGERYATSISEGLDKAAEQGKISQLTRDSFGIGAGFIEGLTGFGESMQGIGMSIDEAINGQKGYNDVLSQRIATKIVNNEREKTGNFGIDISRSIGNMIPTIVVSIATSGLGAPAIVAEMAAPATTFSSVYGSTYIETRRQGYDAQDAATYSSIMAGFESALQYGLNGISAIGKGKLNLKWADDALKTIDKSIKSPTLRKGIKVLATQGIASKGEFDEEYLQSFIEPMMRNIVLHEDNTVDFFAPENFYSGAIGAMTSVGMNTVSESTQTTEQFDRAKRIGESLDTEQIIEQIEIASQFAKGTEAYKNAEFFKQNYTYEDIKNGKPKPQDIGFLVIDNAAATKQKNDIQKYLNGDVEWLSLPVEDRAFIVDPKNTEYISSKFGVEVTSDMSPAEIKEAIKSSVDEVQKNVQETTPVETEESNSTKITTQNTAVATQAEEQINNLVEEYGAKEKGLKKGVILPKRTSETKKLSDLAVSLLSNPDLSEEAKQRLEEGVVRENFSYVPITNKSLEQKANEIFAQKDNDLERVRTEEWQSVVDGNSRFTPEKSVLAITLYNEYLKEGNVQAAYEIALELRGFATEYGQTIQTLSMLNKVTPDGQLYSLERSLSRMNKKWRKKYKGFDGAKINKDLAKKFLEAKTEEEMSVVRNEIIEDIATQVPANWFEKLQAWRRVAMLLNPITHARNIAGNAVSIPARELKDLIAVFVEKTAEKKGYIDKSERTKSVLNPFSKADKKFIDAGNKAYEIAKDVLYENNKTEEMAIQRKKKISNNKVFEFARKLNFKALATEDAWFSKYAYVRAYARAMKARGLDPDALSTEDDIKLSEYALEQALKATYRESNALANALDNFKKLNKVTYIIGEGLFPFTQTPMNVMKQGFEFSPAGVVKGVIDMKKGVESGKYTPAQAIDNLSAGLSGTGIMALGVFLASQGLLSGGGDDEDQNYALVIGDKSYTLDWAMPVAIPLFMGVEMFNAYDTGDASASFKNMMDSITKISEPLFNFTVLSSLNKAIKSASSSDSPTTDIAINLMTSYAGQYVPSIFGAVARVIDDTKRTTYYQPNSELPYGIDSFVQGILKKVAPGKLQPKLDRWGNEVKSGNVGQRIVENMLSPGYYSEKPNTDIDREVDKLFLQTGDTGVVPPVANKKYKINGKEYVLDAKDYTKFSKLLGQNAHDSVKEVISSENYKYMTPSEKAAAIEAAYDYANEKAKSIMFKDYKVNKTTQAIQDGKFSISDFAYYKTATDGIEGKNKEQNQKSVLYSLDITDSAKQGIFEAVFESDTTKENKRISTAVKNGVSVDSFIKASSAMSTLSGTESGEKEKWIISNSKNEKEMLGLCQSFIESEKADYRQTIKYANEQGISPKTYLQRQIQIADLKNDKTEYTEEDVIFESGDLVQFDETKEKSNNTKLYHAETLVSSGYTEDEIAFFWQKEYPDDDKFSYSLSLGLTPSSYVGFKAETFKADVNENGKIVSGSKRAKVENYIDSMNISEVQKLILKMSVTDYSFKENEYERVANYVNGKSLTQKEKLEILDKLGFKIVGTTVYHTKK